ncbi:MAG: 4Fe-4S dicluster domain-containing protein [Clostridiales bacterium]|jgi:Na+-translocating ferredoxin:NAD+ oxidoreductase RnfC subunit|nr:4Fe-4S dicluster domain-containing protein [Clostridiales bacterium]
MDIGNLKNLLQDGGVVGAGGAGFPTYAKLAKGVKYLILNCAECEPLLSLHKQLLEKEAHEILQSLSLIAEIIEAPEIVIGIKKGYDKAISAIGQYIGAFPNIRLHLLDNVYPVGDEIILIYEALGIVISPGGIPIEKNIIVLNVETVYNVYQCVQKQKPVIDKLVTIVGEVGGPRTTRAPIGMAIGDVASSAGVKGNYTYLVGGPMMGEIKPGQAPITKTTNAILVLPDSHYLIRSKKRNLSIDLKRAASACCQCQMCTGLCPRHALGHPIEPHLFMRSASNQDFRDRNVFLNTFFCSSCGVCEMYACPQGLSPCSLIAAYKDGLKKAGAPMPKNIAHPGVKPWRAYRKVPEKRLEGRLGLSKYSGNAYFADGVLDTNNVKILLRQHIGAIPIPIVSAGDYVKTGQMVAKPAEGLSVALHASIDGEVTCVNDNFIEIKRSGKRGGVK